MYNVWMNDLRKSVNEIIETYGEPQLLMDLVKTFNHDCDVLNAAVASDAPSDEITKAYWSVNNIFGTITDAYPVYVC